MKHFSTPLEISAWLLFHLQLLFMTGALAIRPFWFALKKVLVPFGIFLAAALVLVEILYSLHR